jgi:hypothetical protein
MIGILKYFTAHGQSFFQTTVISLKNEYSAFLKKSNVVGSTPMEKGSIKKKISISQGKKNPIFIKTHNSKKKEISPKKPVIAPAKVKISPKKPVIAPAKVKISPKKPVIAPAKVKISPKKPVIAPAKVKILHKKKKNIVSVKSKRRFSKKSKRRKLDRKHTNSRKISFRCYPQKGKNIGAVIKKADKVSADEMKKELLSNGIEIKGTKNKLLKDIYMFSLMGGIKIQRE